jgi:hypothetical protein
VARTRRAGNSRRSFITPIARPRLEVVARACRKLCRDRPAVKAIPDLPVLADCRPRPAQYWTAPSIITRLRRALLDTSPGPAAPIFSYFGELRDCRNMALRMQSAITAGPSRGTDDLLVGRRGDKEGPVPGLKARKEAIP